MIPPRWSWLCITGALLAGAHCVHVPRAPLSQAATAWLQEKTDALPYAYVGQGPESNPFPLGFQFRLFPGGVLMFTPQAAQRLEQQPATSVPAGLLSQIVVWKYHATQGWLTGSLSRLSDGSQTTLARLLLTNQLDALLEPMSQVRAKLPPWIEPAATPNAAVTAWLSVEPTDGWLRFRSANVPSDSQPTALWIQHKPTTLQTCAVFEPGRGFTGMRDIQRTCSFVKKGPVR